MIDVLIADFATNDGTSVTQLTANHTGRSGPNRMIYMIAMVEGTGDSVSSCTYAGGTMRLREALTTAPTGNRIEVWELCDDVDGYSAIPVSSNSVVVNFSDSTSAWIGVIQFNGITRELDTSATTNIENGTVYQVIPQVSKEDTLVLNLFVGGSSSVISPNTGQTTIYNNSSISSMCIFVGYEIEDRGNKTQRITCDTAVIRGIFHIRAHGTYPTRSLAAFGG